MATVREKAAALAGQVASRIPQSVKGAASQLGGGVARGIGHPSVVQFQKQGQLSGFGGNVTASQALGYGGMGAGLAAAGIMGFGAGAVAGSQMHEERTQRMAGDQPIIGSPKMPQDLQAGYLNLAIPGSPLGQMGMLAGNNLRHAQTVQDQMMGIPHQMG
jgi:hypothetical protein